MAVGIVRPDRLERAERISGGDCGLQKHMNDECFVLHQTCSIRPLHSSTLPAMPPSPRQIVAGLAPLLLQPLVFPSWAERLVSARSRLKTAKCAFLSRLVNQVPPGRSRKKGELIFLAKGTTQGRRREGRGSRLNHAPSAGHNVFFPNFTSRQKKVAFFASCLNLCASRLI